VAEKHWSWERKSAHYERQSSGKGLAGSQVRRREPRNWGRGVVGEKRRKTRRAQDTGGGGAMLRWRSSPSLNRLQAEPIWEMSGRDQWAKLVAPGARQLFLLLHVAAVGTWMDKHFGFECNWRTL
jgi:hypothetical protein